MPHLECVNEAYNHYFIVDTPPSSPKKKIKKQFFLNVITFLNEIVRSKRINKKR